MGSSLQMKQSEIINEIIPLSQRAFKGEIEPLSPEERRQLRGAKPLPGGSKYFYKVIANTNGKTIRLIDHDHANKVIGELIILTDVQFPIKNSAHISSIEIDEAYRGQGLAKALYGIAMAILKYTLIAGNSQTPGGRRNWVSLYNIPNVVVQGYVMIDDAYLKNDNDFIDRIMHIGAEYLGKIGGRKRTDHFFAFPLTIDKLQLKNAIKGSDFDLYSHHGHVATEVGMFAQWKP